MTVLVFVLVFEKDASPKKIFDRLRSEHGYTGGYSVVKDVVREYLRRTREMFVPLIHPPGLMRRFVNDVLCAEMIACAVAI